jgi:FkbM family methyltransferase
VHDGKVSATILKMMVIGRIKRYLRMVGDSMLASARERLDFVTAHLNSISSAQNALAPRISALEESQAALIQSSIFVVEALGRIEATVADYPRQITQVVESLSRIESPLGEIRSQIAQLEGIAEGLASGVAMLQADTSHVANQISQLGKVALTKIEGDCMQLAQNMGVVSGLQLRQVYVPTADYDLLNPEVGLLTFLRSYLPSAKAIDVGAHVGEVSTALLDAGYEVYAFEPNPPVFQSLSNRIGANPAFHAYNVAVGQLENEMPLHLARDISPQGIYEDPTVFSSLVRHPMPADLPFTDSIVVPVKTLTSLHQSGTIPDDVALLKIDTEGFDLDVIRGMGSNRYPVICAEFWDVATPFQGDDPTYTLPALVDEVRKLGYHWHLVVYRVWGENHTAFYCNRRQAIPNTWGNIICFQDFETFSMAQRWCSTVLPVTYFRSTQPSPRAAEAVEIRTS